MSVVEEDGAGEKPSRARGAQENVGPLIEPRTVLSGWRVENDGGEGTPVM